MVRFLLLISSLLLLSTGLFAQESDALIVQQDNQLNTLEMLALKAFNLNAGNSFYRYGQFSIPEIEGFSLADDQKMDILDLGQKMGYGQQPSIKFPEGQNLSPAINQSRSNFRIYSNADQYQYSNNPDNSPYKTRNDVYEGVEEPFMTPYYQPYYRNGSQFYYRIGRQNRNSGFYFSRR